MTDLNSIEQILMDSMFDVWKDFISHMPFMLTGLVVLLATWFGAILIAKIAEKMLAKSRLRQSLRDLLLRLIAILVWVFGLLLVAMIVFPGLTPSKALGGLGLASVAIGFAFKEIFENFFAGILLLWKFPMESGDFIECQDVSGKIEKITVRMTTIKTVTDELIVVPNSFLFKNPLTVVTYSRQRRTSIITGVAYGESVEQAVSVISDAVKSCETVAEQKPVQVFPTAFGSSSIDIEVAWWTSPTPLEVRYSRGQVITAIKRALDEHGIEIPFPYRTLTFKDALNINKAESDE